LENGNEVAAISEQIAAIRKLELDEEVEGEKEQAEHKKDGSEGKAALRETADGVKEAGGDYAESRFGARKIKRADRFVAGEIAAEGGEFVFHPDGELVAKSPEV
jgi:hypothetical protein